MTRQPFENLKFRMHNIPKGANLLEEFPELKRHEELVMLYIEKTQPNEIIRYSIYMYDPKSDLLKQEPDYISRKKRAKELSGIFENTSDDLLLEVGWLFINRIFHERKMREWHTLQQELEENNKARWTPIDDTEKDQKKLMEAYQKKGLLRTQAMEIQKLLDTIESEIFNDEDMKKKAYEVLLTTPEKVAAAYR